MPVFGDLNILATTGGAVELVAALVEDIAPDANAQSPNIFASGASVGLGGLVALGLNGAI